METINVKDEGAIRVLELNRPDALNAFNIQLMDDLTDGMLDAAGDDAVKVVVLTGAGRAFTAGADLKEMGKPGLNRKHDLDELFGSFIDFPKPLIVAVNGVGAGVGATVCGLADMVFMAEGARLRCPFPALGLVAEAASTVTFPRLMGRQRASQFLLAAEWLSASECVEAGLALEVLPDAKLMGKAMAQAETLAALPLSSLMKTKQLMMAPIIHEMKDAMRAENDALAELTNSPANKEALKAFAEKREPSFKGM